MYVLDFRDLVSLECTCKSLYVTISQDNYLWFESYKAALASFTYDGVHISDDEYLTFDSEQSDPDDEIKEEKQEEEESKIFDPVSDSDDNRNEEDWNM